VREVRGGCALTEAKVLKSCEFDIRMSGFERAE